MASLQFRIDPDDGKAYTFAQVFRINQGKYSREQIDAYWADMVPVNGEKARPRNAGYVSGEKAQPKSGAKKNYAFSITLSVIFNERTLEMFDQIQFDLPWQEMLKDFEFRSTDPSMTIEDLSTWIESIIEGNYMEFTDGQDDMQAQLRAIWRSGRAELQPDKDLPFQDCVSQHLKSGDSVVVDAYAVAESMMRPPKQWSDEELEKVRASLRFGLNDRVVCNCGPRWLSGHINGTAVPNDSDLLPYLVKTDALPGLPSSTISVPEDGNDDICVQEVCFDPATQLHLIKAAAPLVPEVRPKLRFAAGDKVRCRVRNSPNDGLEQWQPGEVKAIWPELPGDRIWDMDEISGEYADVVAYAVNLAAGGWIFCHKDHHTLIRREGLQPLTRVKGTSKRIEVRTNEDGSKEQIDHMTERRKKLMNELSDSDSD